MRGNAWLIEPSKFAERRLLIAWKCAEVRLPIAWKCVELRPANAWKCAEPRLAWECELRGRLRTAARVRGTRVGSAREVRLKCGSSAWNRGSTHWWVPYLYGTGTLRVKRHDISLNETWAANNNEYQFEGFTYYNYPSKSKHLKSKRESGGLGIFIRHDIHKGVSLWSHTDNIVAWIILKKTVLWFP